MAEQAAQTAPKVLGVIPARGGSTGLPGKNIRPFLGLPLIAHTILFSKLCPEITRCIVTTDSPAIADVARQFGADVPFLRPAELAQTQTPMWPVLKHALAQAEQQEGAAYEYLLLLDATSPTREPADVTECVRRLRARPEADGIIAVSQPEANPIWHCVVDREGWMTDLFEGGGRFACRQDVPTVYHINGVLYLWRAALVRRVEEFWRQEGRYLMYEIPESRAVSIDSLEQFERTELLMKGGQLRLSWLKEQLVP